MENNWPNFSERDEILIDIIESLLPPEHECVLVLSDPHENQIHGGIHQWFLLKEDGVKSPEHLKVHAAFPEGEDPRDYYPGDYCWALAPPTEEN